MKLKKGDKVKVITGKDKGKEGVIDRVYVKTNKVIIPTINMVKKSVKKSEQSQGGIIDIERPMNVSKIMLMCPKCNKPSRTGYLVEGTKKTRICKNCKSAI